MMMETYSEKNLRRLGDSLEEEYSEYLEEQRRLGSTR